MDECVSMVLDPRIIDPARFRQVLGAYPTGVCVVTSVSNGVRLGLAVGSFTAISLQPALVGFFPDKGSTTWRKIAETGRFCVNVLAADQTDLCRRFAAKADDKYGDLVHGESPAGLPLIAMMPNDVTAANSTLTGPNGPIQTCTLHKGNVSDGTAQAILDGDNAVIVMPRDPLADGAYTVTVNSDAGSVTWSFNINRNAPLWEVPPEEFSRVIDVNIKGIFNVVRHFLPAMIEEGRGVIVNFSSGWGRSTPSCSRCTTSRSPGRCSPARSTGRPGTSPRSGAGRCSRPARPG